MNWVDLVIILILILFAIEGYGRPLVSELFDLVSFVVAFFASLTWYNFSSKLFETTFSLPRSFANVLGFITIWFLAEMVLLIVARAVYGKVKNKIKVPSEPYLSAIPSLLRGLIFIAVFLVLITTFPVQPQLKRDVDNSKIGSWLLASTYRLELPLKNVFGGLAQDTLSFLTVEPKTDQSVKLGFQTSNFTFDPQKENRMIDLVNRERAARGLSALNYDSKLRQIARDHSADMFSRGYFSHFTPEGQSVADRASAAGISYLVIGENLAYAPTLDLAFQGLMNSPGHRANILSADYHKIGIGIASGGDLGLMITQDFSN